MKSKSDKELIELCLKEKAQAQHALYQRYAGKMFGVCFRYAKNAEDAKDILQEAFIRVFNYLKDFKHEGSFEGWIRRITVNCAIRYYENNLRRLDSGDWDQHPEVSVEASVLDQMSAEEIVSVINQLPDGYRIVFNLYAIEGFSHKEIAQELNIGESASRSQLARARAQLVGLLEPGTKKSVAC